MTLGTLDWTIIIAFFAVSLIIGLLSMRRSGSSASEFFLSGRNMPWWLLGVSMVATTFSADTPNLVADIVRRDGIAGNWVWWAFLLTGMLTVFIYSKLWRRSGVLTDLEFYELRYGGKEAAFLRGFRAVYLGVFFNVMIMATVCLAAIKIGAVMLGLSPVQTILIASVITVIYASIGGFTGVLFTDFVQFIVAMVGSIWATVYIMDMPEIGGIQQLVSHPNVVDKLNFLPDISNRDAFLSLFVIPLAVQWWSVWYPGSEPGGGGYIAQRMLAAKSEKHAIGATLFFNIAHYALRPWPWILVALASLVIYPSLADLQAAFPNMPADKVKDDLAYPAMMALLPAGLVGLVVASLIAAFMSTISTHLNWGSSYVVNDVFKRFIRKDASERQQVNVGRFSTVFLMALAGLVALYLESAKDSFTILLQIGAGTGLIFILRWFWWRINAYTEITGMTVSFILAIIFHVADTGLSDQEKMVLGVAITTLSCVLVTFITPATDKATLLRFYTLIRPQGKGWRKVLGDTVAHLPPVKSYLATDIFLMVLGVFTVYAMLFGSGYLLFGNGSTGAIMMCLAAAGTAGIWLVWKKVYGSTH